MGNYLIMIKVNYSMSTINFVKLLAQVIKLFCIILKSNISLFQFLHYEIAKEKIC